MAALALLWSTSSLQAQPAEVVGNLAIDSVTVYPGSASVTRSGEVGIPAGTSTLVLPDLPGDLDPTLLQLAIDDADVRFSNLQIQQNYQGTSGSDRENELRERLQALQDERQILVDRAETARSELQLLENLLRGDSGARPPIDGNELTSLIAALSENSAQARERIRGVNIEMRSLERQIEQVRFELDQIANDQRSYSRVHINLQSDNAVTTGITVTYSQRGVSWSWLYEARLDTAASQLALLRQAAISQGTGEDWQDVRLTLSTATPAADPSTPELQPLFVDNRPPPSVQQRADSIQEVVVTGSRVRAPATSFQAATTIDTRYQVDYVIPGRVSVAADRQQRIFPVDRREIDVELVSRAVPSRITRAYLEARFDYSGETPIQNARMQLYRDGARIGSAAVPSMLPGQPVRIPFGVDQRIEVARFDEQQESGSTGVFNRSSLREERVRYEITSRHPRPVQVEVLDQVPVSRNEDITVQIPRRATPADETDVDGEAGLLLWRLTMDPQETATIRHYYDIRYPEDSEIFLTP